NYTVGKKAYGYRGLGDLFVFAFFGLLSTIGSYFLYTYSIDHHIILPAIALGLLSVGVLNLNNMRDLGPDRDAGKITLAVKLGPVLAKKYHLVLIGTSLFLILLFVILYYSSPSNLLVLLAFIPLFIHIIIIIRATKPSDYDGQLKVLALSTFAYAILIGVGYIL
ncbi:1,4-dihydroxy-2-naphthoate octaprenyltransferase, partial [Aegicerativicinus sediminis]